MRMKQYPEEKRKNLSKRDVDDFVQFFGEIKGESKLLLQQMLTPRKGFRKKKKLKQGTLNYIFNQFVSNLKRENEISNPNSDVWNKFGKIFVWWVNSKQELSKILTNIKNEEDFNDDNKCIVDPNSPLDVKCFHTLLDASLDHKIDQETILCFYEYGYFNEDKQIEDLIDKALPRKEIQRRQRIAELPGEFDELSQTIKDLNSRVSAVESANELKQELDRKIAELSEFFESNLQKLDHRISEINKSLDNKLPKIELNSKQLAELSQQVNSLNSQLSELKKSLNTLEDKRQTTESPRIAYQAVEIGENAASLVKNRKKQKNEKDYLQEFRIPLWLLGIIDPMDSSEAKAIHVALKAFSVIEIPDPRIIDAWKAACGNNLHITTLDVGMGWLDSQDWFPKFFSEICFGEQLRQMDLDVSVEEMINKGNILWAIHLNNCDRSYPECYLPRFLKWLGERKVFVKVFLTRCLSENCCKTSFEVYNEVGQLPKPTKMMSIKPTTLPDTDTIVDKSVWGKWCQSVDEKLYQTEFQFLDKLQSEIENIPLSLLQDIQSYLLLSHQTFDDSVKALDWALYLRLYPWLADRTEIEDTLYNLIKQSDFELPRTVDALQGNL